MSKTHADIFHGFYYQGELAKSSYGRVSYCGSAFYSYGTVIAQQFIFPEGHVLLLAYDHMSSTTDRHLSGVMHAAPPHLKKIWFPFERGNEYRLTQKEVMSQYQKEIMAYKEKDMARVSDRRRLGSFVSGMRRFSELSEEPIREDVERHIKQLEPFMAKAEARRAKANETRKANIDSGRKRPVASWRETAEALAPYEDDLRKAPIPQLVKEVFAKTTRKLVPDIPGARMVVREWLQTNGGRFSANLNYCEPVQTPIAKISRPWKNKHRDFQFAWIKGDKVVTGLRVEVPLRQVALSYASYRSHEDKSMFEGHSLCHMYRVIRSDDQVMQIGCHAFPTEFIEAFGKVVDAAVKSLEEEKSDK